MQRATTKLDDPECLFWAGKIDVKRLSRVEGVIDAGKLLLEAKSALPHSKWGTFVHDYISFGWREAQKLMAIAADPRITNTTHAPYLPPHSSTLYVLSRLSEHWFEVGLRSKKIHPRMERADAEYLLRRQLYGKRAKRDPEVVPSSPPSPFNAAWKVFIAECRKLPLRRRGRVLTRLALVLLTTDDELAAQRKRRRESAEETEFLIAQAEVEWRYGPRHEQEETVP